MSFTVRGLDEAIEETGARAERMRHLIPVLDDASREIKTFIEQRFERRESPDGSSWTPVLLRTAIYADTNRDGLKRSRFASVRFSSVAFGAKASFADVHQLGDGRVPARPFAPTEGEGGPSADLIESIKERIERYVRDGDR